MKTPNQVPSDKPLAKDSALLIADEVVEAIATYLPGINIAYKLSKVYLGRGMKLRQQRVLEWVEFVRDNLGEFSKQLFDNEQFQDSFVLLTEGNIRERAGYKRRVYQQLLLGLTKLNPYELEKYQLERMVAVTNQISFEALNLLSFIRYELLEKIESDIQKQLEAFNEQEGVEAIRLENITRDRMIVSDYISKWIFERYNSNSDTVKKMYNLTNESSKETKDEIVYREHIKEVEFMNPLPELANLGILTRKNGDVTMGGIVGSGYSISDFGYMYIKYLEEKLPK